jgi:putative aldouronate transport system substrate-binding protein
MTYKDVPRRILTDTNGGFGGWLSFPKSNIKNEDELRVALGMIDKLLDEEAYGIMTNGIEDEHYEVDADGVITMLDQAAWERDVQPFASSRPSDTLVTYPNTDPYVNEGAALTSENDDYAITNVAQPLTSETFDARWTQVEQAAQDVYNKYIVGQIDMAGYEAAIDELLAGDLGKIQAEYTEAYRAVNG